MHLSVKRQRFRIALGGFLSFVGFAVLAFTVLVFFGAIQAQDSLVPDLLVNIAILVASIDVVAGIFLIVWR